MSSPPSPSSLSTSKSNTLKSLRKRLLDTFDFKSNKVSKRGNNTTHKITIPIPIFITNPNRYYEDGEWLELVKESAIIIDDHSQSNHALFCFKSPPKRTSTIDNVLSYS